MFHTLASQIGLAITVLICAFTAWAGGRPQKVAATIVIVAWVGSNLIQDRSFRHPQYLTLVLDIPVAEGLDRAARRRGAETRYERMAIDFHARVRRGFRAIARAEPRRCVLLDARAGIEELQREIRVAVTHRLRLTAPR